MSLRETIARAIAPHVDADSAADAVLAALEAWEPSDMMIEAGLAAYWPDSEITNGERMWMRRALCAMLAAAREEK